MINLYNSKTPEGFQSLYSTSFIPVLYGGVPGIL